MEQPTAPTRWQAALSQAARQTLVARWRGTLEALQAARLEYRALHAAPSIDVRSLRKAAQRVHDLEQLRAVLAHELGAPRPPLAFRLQGGEQPGLERARELR